MHDHEKEFDRPDDIIIIPMAEEEKRKRIRLEKALIAVIDPKYNRTIKARGE